MKFEKNLDLKIRESIEKAIVRNDGYCPCNVIKNDDTICPCLEFKQNEVCHCNYFVPTNKKENDHV